ncbi:hypothetical protein DFQ28_005286 [Apophysomyces sp. BC1034]|nr:hypothetical protein DFQ30_004085 [Apophysomyces sp. BC1015]KAG0177927.1 hypothetical protein DFQ29_004164 [Apophysomyces sp. BC1021]KAG0188189.1 hypothetical protein DFQ28_005286 [Apophysomyces sp. BC1034]
MSLSIYQYAIALLLLLGVRYLFRWTLELRFHLQFGHIGFFSISDIRYRGTHHSHEAWSIAIGKLKIRLKRPTSQSSSAWITILVEDFDVIIHDLAATLQKEEKEEEDEEERNDYRPLQSTSSRRRLNRRLSKVGDSLRQIPWWYSFSLVKPILKLTSALPAQFIMAGLANYVDFRLDRLSVTLGSEKQLRIDHIGLDSVLFAAVVKKQLDMDEDRNAISLHARHHQRHSLKRAGHLFREKFFEIHVQMGSIVCDEVFQLPTGLRLAIACHLSAGCVTLKDVDISMQTDAVQVKLDKIAEFSKILSTPQQRKVKTTKKQRSTRLVQLIRSISVSLTNITLLNNIDHGVYTSACLRAIHVTVATADNLLLLQESSYKLGVTVEHVAWMLSNEEKVDLELISVPIIKVSGMLSEDLVLGKRVADFTNGGSLAQFLGNDDETLDVGPNMRFAKLDVVVQQPTITVNADQTLLLQKLFSKEKKNETTAGKRKALTNLPKFYITVTVNNPSLHIRNVSAKMENAINCGHYYGQVMGSSIVFDMSGQYTAQDSRSSTLSSSSVLSSYVDQHSVTADVQTVRNRRQTHRWTQLFRRSWRPKEADQPVEKQTAKKWVFTTIGKLNLNDISLHHNREAMTNTSDAFVTIGRIECIAGTRMAAELVDKSEPNSAVLIVHEKSSQVEIETTIERPVINTWNNTDDRLAVEFWAKDVVQAIADLKRKKVTREGEPNREWITYLKMNLNVTQLSVGIMGLDHGVKGSRKTPERYLDNAPEKDIYVHLSVDIDKVTIGFNGSQVLRSGRHSRNRSSRSSGSISRASEDYTDSITNDEKESLGSIRGSIQQLVVKRAFSSEKCDQDKAEVVAWVSRVNATADMKAEGSMLTMSAAVVVQKSGIQYSIENNYACLLAAQALKGIKHAVSVNSLPKERKPRTISLRKLQFQMNRCDVHIFLPEDTQLYLRMDGLRTQWDDLPQHRAEPLPIAIKNTTVFGIISSDPQQWDQLLEADNISFSLEKDVDFETGNLIKTYQLTLSKLYLRSPYQFVFAEIIDNLLNLSKCVKTLYPRLSKMKPFTHFGPTSKNTPISLPRIRLICDTLSVQIEDDPFEARLRLIWRAGLKEQINRNALQEAFEAKAQTVMQTSDGREIDEQTRNRVFDMQARGKEPMSKVDTQVNEAWQRLQEHNSNSWIKHIQWSIQKETSAYDQIRCSDYREACFSEQLDDCYSKNDENDIADMFCIDIVPLPRYPPLLNGTMLNLSMDIHQPDFPLDETRLFVHNIGKGVPLDTDFSLLAPFHMSWKVGETWIQVRDYPLPGLHIPPSHSGVAWSLSGDYVFGDELGSLDATRCITVPVLGGHGIDYSVDIARTSSPPKFYSIVNINVHTHRMSRICWSNSYQPAIQDISRTMENLTKPPVDPSPKVGFWDKIRLMIHTRTKISFVGGGDFAFAMKGRRDPYDMNDHAFGLAKVWSGDVEWLLGHDNPEGEFLQIISRDYAFGVPDLVRGGYAAPHLLPNDSDSTQSAEEDMANLEREQRFVKVALKLSGGIRMGLGCHLERVCSPSCEKCHEVPLEQKCRFLHFLPHYKVKFNTPQSVEMMENQGKNYDAYAGFRSDFIHLSISIVKLSAEQYDKVNIESASMNSMHISPGFLEHFVSWFRLFGGAMSYPVRNGALFPKTDPRPVKKFGKHMSTMKYKVMISPLIIGHFYKDENAMGGGSFVDDIGDSVGLKALVGAFSVDIHQRREFTNVSNHKLDQKRLKANWPVHEAEVQLRNIDIRAVRAKYVGASSAATEEEPPLASVDTASFDSAYSDPDLMDGLDRKAVDDTELSNWVDLDDFVELHTATSGTVPKVQVLPFAFSPCIYYLKQTNRDDIDTYRYLRDTHDCILGTAVDTRKMQMGLLQERSDNIDIQIRKHQARLHSVESKLSGRIDNKDLLKESQTIVEKTEILFEKRNLLQRYLKELSTQAMPNVANDNWAKNTTYSDSTIFGEDSLARWEELMGYFKQRYIVHNPQILWNNSIRNIIYHFLDIQAHKRMLSYYMSARAVKFLRDLTENAQQQRHPRDHSHDQLGPDDNEDCIDSHMAQELIAKLLSEQDTKLYAPNEMEDCRIESNSGKSVDISNTDSVNDPDIQKKSIPTGYGMKSSYLIDLLNPQINLQSDANPNSLVLMSNERMQVKGFNIIDTNGPDVETELVKNRTIVSIDNAQFFVAKKEQFDSVDLLLDNHYGAKENDHWLAWIPPEMLINYVKRSDKFQRVGNRLAATVQYDKYNPLRIKAGNAPATYAQIHPFEDRCDSVHLNFPRLALTANSLQYNAIYEVVVDLLLYKEPAKKERLARLREIMMAADRGSLYDTTEKIVELQDRVRRLTDTRDHYRENASILDEKQIDEYKEIRTALFESREELYLGMEAIKLTQSNQRKGDHEPKTNLKFVFSAEKLVWEMLADNDAPLCEWNLTNTNFILVSKEDHSSSNTVEIEQLHVKNTTSSPAFTDVLGPYMDRRKIPDFSRHKMLRCYLVSLAPVGGIPVIQHLEINLFPLKLQMTYDFGKALGSYFFPAERRQKLSDTGTTPSSSTPAPAISVSETDASESQKSTSMNLLAENRAADKDISSSRSGSFCNGSYARSVTTESGKALETAARDSNAELDAQSETSAVLAPSSSGRKGLKHSKQKLLSRQSTADDLSVMKKRASRNQAYILVKIPGAKHCLSYQGPKEKNIEDLREFVFQQPNLEYRNKTWSWYELISTIKKDFMRAALLNNSTALLKEKLLIRRHHPRESNTAKLAESNLSTHSGLMFPEDILFQEQGRYDLDNMSELTESSKDEEEDLDKDAVSLHSANSQENWDQETSIEPTKPTRHLLPWSRRFRKAKPLTTDNDHHIHPEDDTRMPHRRSIGSADGTAPLSVSAAAGTPPPDEEITAKGRLLLGKYYNGPTFQLPVRSKGKAINARSNKAISIKSFGSGGRIGT